jgi:endogenous inhibitor of DNA gyrase (YacG/DUF329 family)
MAHYKCAFCGKDFTRMPCKSRGIKPFCSQSCRNRYYALTNCIFNL